MTRFIRKLSKKRTVLKTDKCVGPVLELVYHTTIPNIISVSSFYYNVPAGVLIISSMSKEHQHQHQQLHLRFKCTLLNKPCRVNGLEVNTVIHLELLFILISI